MKEERTLGSTHIVAMFSAGVFHEVKSGKFSNS